MLVDAVPPGHMLCPISLDLMHDPVVAADGHTAALEIAVHGNAGRLDAAEAALDRAVARGDADAVVHNAFVGAAAKVADAEAALAALRRHPAPDITSYNSALAAISVLSTINTHARPRTSVLSVVAASYNFFPEFPPPVPSTPYSRSATHVALSLIHI